MTPSDRWVGIALLVVAALMYLSRIDVALKIGCFLLTVLFLVPFILMRSTASPLMAYYAGLATAAFVVWFESITRSTT